MVFMPWSEEYRIGIAAIDEQHRWLVDNTNRLHDELTKPDPDRASIGEILEGLVDYAFNHFIVEEELFKRFDYPDEQAHLAEHNGFTTKATELLERFENGESVSTQALEFLKNWLIHHILEVDKAYVPFMREKGIV
jgi:hemerythrin-like metal-binding domain